MAFPKVFIFPPQAPAFSPIPDSEPDRLCTAALASGSGNAVPGGSGKEEPEEELFPLFPLFPRHVASALAPGTGGAAAVVPVEEEAPQNIFARGSSEVSLVSTLVWGEPDPVLEEPPVGPNEAEGPWPDDPYLIDKVHMDVVNFGQGINWTAPDYARVFAWCRIGTNARVFLDDTDPNKYQRLYWASGCAQENGGFVPWLHDIGF